MADPRHGPIRWLWCFSCGQPFEWTAMARCGYDKATRHGAQLGRPVVCSQVCGGVRERNA